MARKLKVIDLTTVDNSNANQQITETPTEKLNDDTHEENLTVEPIKEVKPRKRTSRSLKSTKEIQVEPIQDKPVEEVEVIENKPVEEIQVSIAEPLVEQKKKDIKTVELVECPKCGKKLTERTLKYSHQSKCSKMKINNNK